MSSIEQLTEPLKKLTVKEKNNETSDNDKPKFDKAALRERWKLLGADPEQNILSMIRKACMETFAREDFFSILSSIKQSFVQRDYEGIFTDPINLAVYTAAYIPGRALCYYEIFTKRPQLLKILAKRSNLYCVGSGSGSELTAIAAAMTRLPAERQKVNLVMQDIGDYQSVLASIEQTIREKWLLTQEQLQCSYEQGDILDSSNELIDKRLAESDLITFMFVMNELFVKKAAALALIQRIVRTMKRGAHLLVRIKDGPFATKREYLLTYSGIFPVRW
ncbi:hypothetical protein BDF20DRAFT_852122 [Mycotypha africana]|uniref:uncharacterized protein n=1 Tax=Mycotypha africana TaxID=64632 RepID=UPI002301AC94|nr:uncharacterized protein BDF20DRAFT_852122 [Mycotypha africana]KAI8987769.1 hypothetical protein BDF20DRAFT_852122 [Mycotypha africana]